MKAFVIQHLHFEDLGNLQPVLQDSGYNIEYFNAVNPDHLDYINKNTCDLLVVLGGPIGVYEEDSYPFLTQEKNIIKQRIEQKQAIIGICLGGQLIASVLGANVYASGEKEIGWKKISAIESSANNQFSKLDQHHVLHWHGDTFDLPKGAKRIFSSARYPNQGFVYGENILALQFHVEVQPQRIEEWLVGHACEVSGLEVTGLEKNAVNRIREDTKIHAPILQELAKEMWHDWISNLVIQPNTDK